MSLSKPICSYFCFNRVRGRRTSFANKSIRSTSSTWDRVIPLKAGTAHSATWSSRCLGPMLASATEDWHSSLPALAGRGSYRQPRETPGDFLPLLKYKTGQDSPAPELQEKRKSFSCPASRATLPRSPAKSCQLTYDESNCQPTNLTLFLELESFIVFMFLFKKETNIQISCM